MEVFTSAAENIKLFTFINLAKKEIPKLKLMQRSILIDPTILLKIFRKKRKGGKIDSVKFQIMMSKNRKYTNLIKLRGKSTN